MIEIAPLSPTYEHRFAAVIVGTAVAMGALFYALVWSADGLGINLVLAQAAFVTATFVLSRRTGHEMSREAWVPAAASLAFASAFALFASPFALAVAMLGFLVSQAVFLLYVIGHHADFHHPLTFVHTAFFLTPIHVVSRIGILRQVPLPRALPSNARAILFGFLALLPILLVFGMLFASADPLFGRYFGDLLDIDSLPNGVRHLIGVAFWSCVSAAVFGLAFWKRETFAPHLRPDARWHTESTVVLCGVIALFAVFLVVQATYLFGGEAAFNATGYTFSEYARRGFNELVAVATIVLLLFLSLRFFHGDRASATLRALHAVLFGETLLVLLSAVIRMNLYVDAYGYTPARLFTYWFLAAVASLLVLSFVHLLRQEEQPRLMRHGLVVLAAFALGFVYSSPDALSFRLNADRIVAAGFVDAGDVYASSADAYPTMKYLEAQGVTFANGDETSSEKMRRFSSSFAEGGDWRTWSWTKARVDQTKPFPWLGCLTPKCQP